MLAHLPRKTAEEIAQSFPEIDYILATHEQELTGGRAPWGDARVQYCGDQGRYILETRLRLADDRSIAKELGAIRWEYIPDRDEVSLLEPMRRYFDDFPWEGAPQRKDNTPHLEDHEDLDLSEEIDKEIDKD